MNSSQLILVNLLYMHYDLSIVIAYLKHAHPNKTLNQIDVYKNLKISEQFTRIIKTSLFSIYRKLICFRTRKK